MTQTLSWKGMTPELTKVAERAKREPSALFHSLAHLMDFGAFKRAYSKMRANAAVGVDGVTKEKYGENLDENIQDLLMRLKTKRYRHQPIKRVFIPKEDGSMRPLGISAFEDKLVQEALREVLSAVYEQDFLDCSHGYRPGRKAHDAIVAIDREAMRGRANWVYEADIRKFFDSVPHQQLVEIIRKRVPDGTIIRLVEKCLRAGILEGEELLSADEVGTPQGSVLSPLLANIFLHEVLDKWLEYVVRPHLRGDAQLVRFADDFVICFSLEYDARRVISVIEKRLERFGLQLHPDKTRLLPFNRPVSGQKKGNRASQFDFLGFTLYWKLSKRGKWIASCKTRRSRLNRTLKRISDYCRHNRHLPLKEQWRGLCRRLQGHYNYFGVSGNYRSLKEVFFHTGKTWFKWLKRRSNRTRLTVAKFYDGLLERLPLPSPRISVNLWSHNL